MPLRGGVAGMKARNEAVLAKLRMNRPLIANVEFVALGALKPKRR